MISFFGLPLQTLMSLWLQIMLMSLWLQIMILRLHLWFVLDPLSHWCIAACWVCQKHAGICCIPCLKRTRTSISHIAMHHASKIRWQHIFATLMNYLKRVSCKCGCKAGRLRCSGVSSKEFCKAIKDWGLNQQRVFGVWGVSRCWFSSPGDSAKFQWRRVDFAVKVLCIFWIRVPKQFCKVMIA